MTTREEILKYYSDLLIIQYYGKPKFKAFIEACVEELIPINEKTGNLLTNDIQNGFDIDNAEGVQLDIIGKYVGLSRYYTEVSYVQDDYFGLTEYNQTDIPDSLRGFADYSDVDKQGKTLVYDNITDGAAKLSDFDYRTLLKLKIIKNNRDAAIKTIDDAMYIFFGPELYFEEIGPMKIIYWYASYLQDIVKFAFARDVIPRPAGVQLIGAVATTDGGYFGLPSYDNTELEVFTGFTNYLEFDTKEGAMLDYVKMTI